MLDSIRQSLQTTLRFWLSHMPLGEKHKLFGQAVLAHDLALQPANTLPLARHLLRALLWQLTVFPKLLFEEHKLRALWIQLVLIT